MLKLEKRHNFVYYVAPLFHLPSDLSKNYFNKTVAQESRFIRPSVIKKMPDQHEHFVSFRKTGKPWRFSNDPVELELAESAEDVVARIKEEFSRNVSIKERLKYSLDQMIETLDEEFKTRTIRNRLLRDEVARIRDMDMSIQDKSAFIARNFFDAELLVFGKPAEAPKNKKNSRLQ